MPNWKKVIVSGSDASLNNISSENITVESTVTSLNVNTTNISASKYFVEPTGSGSVPAKSYQIPFVDTSSADNYGGLYKDNQSKLEWTPAGELTVIGNIVAGGTGFITGSNVNASTNVTVGGQTNTANLRINSIPTGSDQNKIVVVGDDGSTFFRTNL